MTVPWIPPPGTKPRPGNVVLMALTGALFAAGAVMMAGWLRDRGTALDAAPPPPPPQARSVVTRLDPRVEAFLGGGVSWGPEKRDWFGPSPAVLVSGHAEASPREVFRAMVGEPLDDEAVQAAIRKGPSAAVALRSQLTIGVMPQGAFLLRLAPDLDAARHGRLATEPGAVTLAFPAASGWDYVTWVFPRGLSLDGLPDAYRAPPRALDDLGAAAVARLEPVFQVNAGVGGGPRTVLCRARGRAGDAVSEVAGALIGTGWTSRYGEEHHEGGLVRVLEDGRRQVWLAAADEDQDGGLVSVVVGSL